VSLAQSLHEHERAWIERPLLRRIYREWFALLATRLSPVVGVSIELGSGIGQLRDFVPGLVTTDVEETPWADRVIDAAALPYADGELANIVMLDVFHHLPRPAAFLDEARRALAARGRVVMLEPYVSWLSGLAYRLHHERLELDADGFAESETTDPLDANLAQTTIAFFRQRTEYARRWPELPVVEERLLSLLVYPLSGGFTRRPLLPQALYRPLMALERALSPMLPLAAFRCLLVLERRSAGFRAAMRTEPAIARAGVASSTRSTASMPAIKRRGVPACRNSKGSATWT
jgi:SAM-dependent methyltransferase